MIGGFTPVGHNFAALRRVAHHYIKIMMILQYPIVNCWLYNVPQKMVHLIKFIMPHWPNANFAA
jgi:hypothetical protein